MHVAGGTYGVAVNVTSTYPSLAYAQADGTVSVSYSTANGTAKSGTNYKGHIRRFDDPGIRPRSREQHGHHTDHSHRCGQRAIF